MSSRADHFDPDDQRDLHNQLRQLREEFEAATRDARGSSAPAAASFEFEALRCELDRLRAAVAHLQHSTPNPAASTCAPVAACAPAVSAAPPYPPFPPYPPYPPVPPFPPFPPYPPNCGCCAPAPCGCSKCGPTHSKTEVVRKPQTPTVSSSSNSSSSSSSSSPWRRGVVVYPQRPTSSSASYDPHHVK